MSNARGIETQGPEAEALEDDDEKHLAERIGSACRTAREALTLTQAEVAEMIGVNAEYYGRIERGAATPSLTKLASLATALAVSVDFMLGKSNAASSGLPKPVIQHPPALRRVIRLINHAQPGTVRVVLAVLEKIHGRSSSTEEEEQADQG